MDKKDFLVTTLDRIQEWIRAADQKVSIFLAFQGIILTILIPDFLDWILRNYFYLHCLLFLFSLGFLSILSSLFISIFTISPVLKHQSSKSSITYFGDIGNMETADYRKKISELKDLDYEEELINQIHINSKIASRKHGMFKWSVITFVTGSLLLILTYMLLFI